MKPCLPKLTLGLIAYMLSFSIHAQSITISGNVRDVTDKSVLPAVSVSIKGTGIGTFTDDRGDFRIITNQRLPLILVITSIGYERKEVEVTDAGQHLQIEFKPVSILGVEVVVSATRSEIRSLESPV